MKLITADWHLTDDPLSEYKWGLFPWLVEIIKDNPSLQEVYILGDLTEKKDKHSSTLINRIVTNLEMLIDAGVELFILKGNHDYIDADSPFFDFLKIHPYINYISQTTPTKINNGSTILFLPHTDTIEKQIELFQSDSYDYIFMHQAIEGVQLQYTSLSKGIPISLFNKLNGKIYSGDIHLPQKIGNVEYVGAPYPIYFGDTGKYRVILIDDDDKVRNLYYPTITKYNRTISDIHDLDDVQNGDQIKIKYSIEQADLYQWKEIRQTIHDYCQKKGIILCSLEALIIKNNGRISRRVSRKMLQMSPEQIFNHFADKEKLEDIFIERGREFLYEQTSKNG